MHGSCGNWWRKTVSGLSNQKGGKTTNPAVGAISRDIWPVAWLMGVFPNSISARVDVVDDHASVTAPRGVPQSDD
jgi:hypothetical protein